ncbi:MAG: hypothetical protein AB8B97_16950 [Granulosicoccus sp.]
MHPVLGLAVSLSLLSATVVIADTLTAEPIPGILDVSIQETITTVEPDTPPPAVILVSSNPEEARKVLRTEFAEEQRQLEKLPRPELQARAERGERAAQVTLAEDFAREAALLSYAPEAASQAMGDAVRWMSAAAKSGFPGAPTLDQAGVKTFPVRAPRGPLAIP